MGRDYRSHTQLSTVMRCERKFHYAYIEGLRKKIPSTPLRLGSWFHTLMEADTIERGLGFGSLLAVPEEIQLDVDWAQARVDAKKGQIVLEQTVTDDGERMPIPAKLAVYPLSWHGAHQMMLRLAEETMPDEALAGWTKGEGPRQQWVPDLLRDMMVGWRHHHRVALLRERPLLVEQRGSVVIDDVRFEFRFDSVVLDGSVVVLRDAKTASQMPSSMTKFMHGQRMLYGLVANHAPAIQRVLKRKVAALELDVVKNVPAPRPAQNKDGSLSKKQITSTAVVYTRALQEYGMDPTLAHHAETIAGMDSEHSYFMRDRVPMHPIAMKEIVRDYLRADLRARSLEEGAAEPARDIQQSCEWMCDFKDICQGELYGQDTTRIRKMEFDVREPSEQAVDLEDYEELQP